MTRKPHPTRPETARDQNGLAVHPTGGWVCLGRLSSGAVDTETLEPTARVQTSETPRHPRFSTDGQRWSVPNVDGNSFTTLDTTVPFAGDDAPTVRETIQLPHDSAPSSRFPTERPGRRSHVSVHARQP